MTIRTSATLCAMGVAVFVGFHATVPSARHSELPVPQPVMSGWRTLFDGTSLDAWRGYKNTPIPVGWHLSDGTLAKDAPVADIVTKDQFGDFELEIDWKIGEAG